MKIKKKTKSLLTHTGTFITGIAITILTIVFLDLYIKKKLVEKQLIMNNGVLNINIPCPLLVFSPKGYIIKRNYRLNGNYTKI